MTRFKFLLGLLCAYAGYYTVAIFCNRRRHKRPGAKPRDETTGTELSPRTEPLMQTERKAGTVLVQNTVARSLYAYDNSNHQHMVHVRFDAQTVDLLNKFKMATGTDMTKFVAFAVKYLFEADPELKTIIKTYLQNTRL